MISSSASEDSEAIRAQFRQPRDTLLNVVCDYLNKSNARLAELSKKIPDLHPTKGSYELLDVKCHLRLAEIAHSLLKMAPYDPQTMANRGLVRYMNEVLPYSEWRQEAMRPALIIILRRLDKMFNKIAKKGALRRCTDWDAAKKLLKGIYSTFLRHPYIVHLPHLKSLISVCQYIILGDCTGLSMTGLGSGTGVMVNNGVTLNLTGVAISAQSVVQREGQSRENIGGKDGGRESGRDGAREAGGLSNLLTADLTQLNQLSGISQWTMALAQSPPPGFSSVAVRLIALQILQLNENQTLETLCSGVFSGHNDKAEIHLMNMIYPMCIRISGAVRDGPKLRNCDITFILTVVLNILHPSTGSNVPTLGGGTGTATSALGSALGKPTVAASTSAHLRLLAHTSQQQIGFLGLKILIACFERQLSNDWYRIARCVRDIMQQSHSAGVTLWNFIDFVVTYRTPLFILLQPYVRHQLLHRVCDNDQEYYYQQLIAEKLQGRNMPQNRSKGKLLVTLLSELKGLKEDLVSKRIGEEKLKPSQLNAPGVGSSSAHGVGHRLSFAIATALQSSSSRTVTLASTPSQQPECSSGGATSNTIEPRENSSGPAASLESGGSTPSRIARGLLSRGLSFRSHLTGAGSAESRQQAAGVAGKQRGLSVRLPERDAPSRMLDRFLRRTSYPYHIEETPKPPGKCFLEKTIV